MRRLVVLQINSGRPPEVRTTFDRLVGLGLAPRRARRMIRALLVREAESMLRERRFFDDVDFVRRLDLLPDTKAFDTVLANEHRD